MELENKILLSIGTNFGVREENIEKAIDNLISSGAIESASIASIYETEPHGITEQAWFLNTALLASTTLTPLEFLQISKSIEYSVGRTQRKRWHEREIDIDIIYYNDIIYKDNALILPHPRLEKRRFVLVPCNEIAPDYVHPINKLTIKQLLNECTDTSIVRFYG